MLRRDSFRVFFSGVVGLFPATSSPRQLLFAPSAKPGVLAVPSLERTVPGARGNGPAGGAATISNCSIRSLGEVAGFSCSRDLLPPSLSSDLVMNLLKLSSSKFLSIETSG
jgi:hypothetical protein